MVYDPGQYNKKPKSLSGRHVACGVALGLAGAFMGALLVYEFSPSEIQVTLNFDKAQKQTCNPVGKENLPDTNRDIILPPAGKPLDIKAQQARPTKSAVLSI